MAVLTNTQTLNQLTINKVDSQSTFEDMINNNQVNANEFYLVEGDQKDIFFAEYNVTPFSEIAEAFEQGKEVICREVGFNFVNEASLSYAYTYPDSPDEVYALRFDVGSGYYNYQVSESGWIRYINDPVSGSSNATGKRYLIGASGQGRRVLTNSHNAVYMENGTLTATAFNGNGASLTALNASNVATGILPVANGGTGANSAANAVKNLLGTTAIGSNSQPVYWNGSSFTVADNISLAYNINADVNQGTAKGVAYYDNATGITSTAAGAVNTALMGKGSSAAPEFVAVAPSIGVTDGTASAAPKLNVTALGVTSADVSLPTATQLNYGVTKLEDSIASISTTSAATPNAVKTAYDLADSKQNAIGAAAIGSTTQPIYWNGSTFVNASQVFYAEYNVTPYSAIAGAINANQAIFVKDVGSNTTLYSPLTSHYFEGGDIYFTINNRQYHVNASGWTSGPVSSQVSSLNSASKLYLVGAQYQTRTEYTNAHSNVYMQNGTLTATAFNGNGASLTALNASNVATGVLPIANGGTGADTAANAMKNLVGSNAIGTNSVPVYWNGSALVPDDYDFVDFVTHDEASANYVAANVITSGVMAVKGSAEGAYRIGSVSINAENILGSIAIGSNTQPVYWNGSTFVPGDRTDTVIRENLLDNWYFVGGGSQQGGEQLPINTRGQTSYTASEQMYTIDRWYKNSALSVEINSDSVSLTRSSSGGDNFSQNYDGYASLAGKICTLSVLATGDSGTDITVGYNDGGSNTYNTTHASLSGTPVLQTFTFTVRSSPTNLRIIIRGTWPSSSAKINLLAVKLELGSTQTLAHQENGVWVLNEIPNYEEQMVRCGIVETIPRPNLLDNWYFVGGGSQQGGGQFPINNTGLTSYTTHQAYTIDKWRLYIYSGSSTVALTNNGVNLSGTDAALQQFIYNTNDLLGKQVTLSALIDGELIYNTAVVPSTFSAGLNTILVQFTDYNISLISRTAPAGDGEHFMISIGIKTTTPKLLQAVKLELGNTQTLAHKDESGNWVLNEIPNYEEQLVRLGVVETIPRPNLLDNWYFVGGGSQQGGGQFPINTRAQTSYIGGRYCIDNWYVRQDTTASLQTSGLKLEINNTTGYAFFSQRVRDCEQYLGKTMTISFLVSENQSKGVGVAMWASNAINLNTSSIGTTGRQTGTGLFSKTFTVPDSLGAYSGITVGFDMNSSSREIGDYCIISAAKLELGSTQTLAHQENGVWVLNELPNYEEQLVRCGIIETIPRPNLLDNWYFVGGGSQQGGGQFPINSNGVTSKTGTGNFINKWDLLGSGASASLQSDCLLLTTTASTHGFKYPISSLMVSELAGKTVTFSVLTGTVNSNINITDTGGLAVVHKDIATTSNSVTSFTFVVNGSATSSAGVLIWGGDSASAEIIAAKLELGATQTLAHKEGDTWVLNELPNYEEEVLKCNLLTPKRELTAITSGKGDLGSGVSPRYIPYLWYNSLGHNPVDGEMILIKTPGAGNTAGVYLSINGDTTANYHPIVASQTTGRLTTHFSAGTSLLLIYEANMTADAYPIAGADARSAVTGIWRVLNYYDSNTNTLLRTYKATNSIDLPLLLRNSTGSQTAANAAISTYADSYGAIANVNVPSVNPSTGQLTVPYRINANSFGPDSIASGTNALALGSAANATGTVALAIGRNSLATDYAISIGFSSNATAYNSIAIGVASCAAYNYSYAIGHNARTTRVNSIMFGDSGIGYVMWKGGTNLHTSDIRDKTDIEEIPNGATEFLDKLTPIKYRNNFRDQYQEPEEWTEVEKNDIIEEDENEEYPQRVCNLSAEEREKREKYFLGTYDKEAWAAGTKKSDIVKLGVTAQDVLQALEDVYGDSKLFPLVYDALEDYTDEELPEDVERQYSLDYIQLIPFLIKSIQEMDARIKVLEEKLNE